MPPAALANAHISSEISLTLLGKDFLIMDFKDEIQQFAKRIDRLLPQINIEEATKTSLIMPFLRILGYDVFDPFEVQPEFIADISYPPSAVVPLFSYHGGKVQFTPQ